MKKKELFLGAVGLSLGWLWLSPCAAHAGGYGFNPTGLVSTAVYGIVGIMLSILGYKIYDWTVPFSLTKELEEDQNTAVGLVVAGIMIGVAIIVAAAIVDFPGSGTAVQQTGSFKWGGLVSTAVYGIVGIMLSILGYKIYDWTVPFSLTKELEEDQNTAVGLVVAGIMIGVAIIVAAAII